MKYLIVGAGFFGATCARLLTEYGHNCIVIEKSNYIGGHCHTERIKDICVHKYGPHVFHTNNDAVWQFVNRFASFNDYKLKVKVNFQNRIYSFPINLLTINQIFNEAMTPEQAKIRIKQDCISCENPQNFEEAALSSVGKQIYETFFKGYTAKQWGKTPAELPSTILSRIPVRYNYDDGYFAKHRCKYEGIPIGGYTDLITKMLLGITVLLQTPFDHSMIETVDKVIYTGPIDQFYNFIHGILPYRSLKFEYEYHDIEDYQGTAVMNFTDVQVPYTRITEHKHFDIPNHKTRGTIISKEYPELYTGQNEPFYPINDLQNQQMYEKYVELAKLESKVVFGGRLGLYQYLDMDQTIEAAMSLVSKEIV